MQQRYNILKSNIRTKDNKYKYLYQIKMKLDLDFG